MAPQLVDGIDTTADVQPALTLVVAVVTFSLRSRILGEGLTIYSLPALFFFFKVEISLRILVPFFRPGSVHSGWAS